MEDSDSKNTQQMYHTNQQAYSLEDYRKQKMFPHIADYYNFRINNRILLGKIINPRRDKTIMESLAHAKPKSSFVQSKLQKTREPLRKNHGSTLTHFGKTEGFSSGKEENNQTRHTSKTTQRMKTVRADSLEEEKILEEECKRKREGNSNSLSTVDNSVRSHFLGKIVRNVRKEPIELNQSVINCDLSFSCTVPSGCIYRNGSFQSMVPAGQAKIKRIHRHQLSRQLQQKENYSLRVQDFP